MVGRRARLGRLQPDPAGRLGAGGYAALALDYHGGGRVYSDPAELATRLDEMGSPGCGPSAEPGLTRCSRRSVSTARGSRRSDTASELSLSWSWPELERISRQSSASTLASPQPDDSRNITGRVLMCVGADDPIVTADQRAEFEAEMRAARVDRQLNVYGDARHRFTDPEAASAGKPALAYNALAAERVWRAMLDHLPGQLRVSLRSP